MTHLTRGRYRLLAPVLFLLLSPPAAAAQAKAPPAWFKAHLEELAGGSGRWLTDNAAYRSDQETDDTYGLEWRYGPGRQSMTGRLFGMAGGRETGTYWHFVVYWHPSRQEAVILQVGAGGAVGEGTLKPKGAGTESDQTFWGPDGSRTRVGHEAVTSGDEHRTRSFDWVDGGWKARREYVWKRAG